MSATLIFQTVGAEQQLRMFNSVYDALDCATASSQTGVPVRIIWNNEIAFYHDELLRAWHARHYSEPQEWEFWEQVARDYDSPPCDDCWN